MKIRGLDPRTRGHDARSDVAAYLLVGGTMRLRLLMLGPLVAAVLASIAACSDEGSAAASRATADGLGLRDGGACAAKTEPGARACVPATAKANTVLQIELGGSACSFDCHATYACTVSVQGTEVSVTMRSERCDPGPSAVCDASCSEAGVLCTIPPLDAGTYTVTAVGVPARQMIVAQDAADTGCALGVSPPSVNVTPFSRACAVDADCVAVTPDVCDPCACSTQAIARSARTAFDGASSAVASQCPYPRASASTTDCPGCAPANVMCGPGGVCTMRW